MCNEVFFSDGAVMPQVRALLSKMVAHSHELDLMRPAGIGGCQRGELDHLGDIAGYNGDGARLPEYQNPGIPNLVTEYGSYIEDRRGFTNRTGRTGLRNLHPWRSGRALWCMFDHGSIYGHFGFMGLVDYFRLPKRSYYWYRNALRKIPPPDWPPEGAPAKLRLEADKAVIVGDGTDDCQIIVTVLDADGRHIRNSVPVTLSIESGPGAFPTGPQIPFAPDSEIAIRDGQAAIEFRSYEAGRTVLRASSPGLTDATLLLTTHGPVPFHAASRKSPFVRLHAPVTPVAASGVSVNLALNHPTRAESEKPGFPASLANDGDPITGWLAADSKMGVWWQVDLERFIFVSRVELLLNDEKNYRYKIEMLKDSQTWKMGMDQTQTRSTTASRADDFPLPIEGRFLRVTFTGLPAGTLAGLREVKVYAQR